MRVPERPRHPRVEDVAEQRLDKLAVLFGKRR